MIFDQLGLKNKFTANNINDCITITDSNTNSIACIINIKEHLGVMSFELFIDEKCRGVINEMAYNELLSYFNQSKASVLETTVSPFDPNIEYLHSHNFSMIAENNNFKLTYKLRSYHD